MNWHLSRLGLAVLSCVAVFLCCFGGFAFGFGFFGFLLVCGDFVTAYWTVHRSINQFTLEAPQYADGHVYALIN